MYYYLLLFYLFLKKKLVDKDGLYNRKQSNIVTIKYLVNNLNNFQL